MMDTAMLTQATDDYYSGQSANHEFLQNDQDESVFNTEKAAQLNKPQFFQTARKMEHSRRFLCQLIINNQAALQCLAEEYLLWLDKGLEQSEMFSIRYTSSNSADSNSSTKQFGSALRHYFQYIRNAEAIELSKDNESIRLAEIHFLPVFIQTVCVNLIKHQVLSNQQALVLQQHQKQMINSRQRIINSNLRMVSFIVKKYKRHNLCYQDLMQEGTIGLIKAVDRYDYLRPVQFSTYAVYWIRQMLSRMSTKQSKQISLPYNLAAKISTVFNAMNGFLSEHDKWPTTVELSKCCDVSIKEIEYIFEFYKPCISITTPLNKEDESTVLLDTLEQHHYRSADTELISADLEVCLNQAISSLSDREAFVIRWRFGLHSGIELTLQEIAEQINVSKERVRQIQNTALSKLKHNFSGNLHEFLTNSAI